MNILSVIKGLSVPTATKMEKRNEARQTGSRKGRWIDRQTYGVGSKAERQTVKQADSQVGMKSDK